MPDDKKLRMRSHMVTMENRQKAVITGVEDVDSFNEEEVILLTDAGEITLVGSGLHISKLNLDEGMLVVEGYIVGMDYSEKATPRGGFFSRIFK